MDLENLKSRARLLLAIGGLIMVAACALAWISPPGTEAAQGDWGEFRNIGPIDSDLSPTSEPQIAGNDDGTVAAVWIRSGIDGDELWGWFPTGPEDQSAGHAITAPVEEVSDPRVVVTPTGSIAIAWISSTAEGSVVRTWVDGEIRSLSAGDAEASDLSLATGGGTVSAAWVSQSDSGRSVMSAISAGGEDFGPPEEVAEVSSDRPSPSVGVNPDGDTIVVFIDLVGGHQVIRVALRPYNGLFNPPELAPATIGDAEDPRIWIDSEGRMMLVWRAISGGVESNWALRDRELASYPIDLTYAAAPGSRPQVSLNSNNEAIAVWTEVVGDETAVFAQTFGLETGQSDTRTRLSAVGVSASNPRVSSGADGTTTVVWEEGGPDPVVVSATRETSKPFAAASRIPSPGFPDTEPAVTVGASGQATAVWRSGPYIRAASTIEPVKPPPPDPVVDPPPCRPKLSVGKIRRFPGKGTATVTVRVNGAGRVVLSGRRIRTVIRAPRGPARLDLKVHTKGKAAKQLRQRGRLRVKARVTYRPAGRCSAHRRVASKTVKLVKRKQR